MYRIYSPQHSHVTSVRIRTHFSSSLNTSLSSSHTRKCHYQWFRRCKKGTCSFLSSFATRVRMDWEELFVIVRLSALLPVWWSQVLSLFFNLFFTHLGFSWFPLISFKKKFSTCVFLLFYHFHITMNSKMSQMLIMFSFSSFPPFHFSSSSPSFGKSWSWFQLRTRGEGSVCDGCGVCHGPCSAPHAPGPLLRLPGSLPSHGQQHRWQRAAQLHPCCQL